MSVVFFSYSHDDEGLRNELETHLSLLKRQGAIETWYVQRLEASDHVDHVDQAIDRQLERADIILLLVSPDFLASDYCYGVEMVRALDRHARIHGARSTSVSGRVF